MFVRIIYVKEIIPTLPLDFGSREAVPIKTGISLLSQILLQRNEMRQTELSFFYTYCV